MAAARRAVLLAGGAPRRHCRSSASALPWATSRRLRPPELQVAGCVLVLDGRRALHRGCALVPDGRRAFSALSKDSTSEDVEIDTIAYSYMASQALFTALELGVFDKIAAVGESGMGATDLGEAIGVAGPRLQTLLTALVAIKCLKLDAEGLYHCSRNTERFMVSSSKHYYGDFLKLQMGRPFQHQMGGLAHVMRSGTRIPGRVEDSRVPRWFEDPKMAQQYSAAQHYGSEDTAKTFLEKQRLDGASQMLDVAGGVGALSYVLVGATPGLESTVLEIPSVCRAAEEIREKQPAYVRHRVNFVEMDANVLDWPVEDNSFDVVVMSYLSGSVPEPAIGKLYANAFQTLRSGGRLFVHDFIVDDDFAGPALAALWALLNVTVNADGLGLSPSEIISRMESAGFDQAKSQTFEMIEGMTKLVVGYKS